MPKSLVFAVIKTIPGCLGRAGIIKTAHGEIKTPAFSRLGKDLTEEYSKAAVRIYFNYMIYYCI